jgi:hypothetical protein
LQKILGAATQQPQGAEAMKILVACEFSGVVREAFRKRGHEAWSCDLLPTEISSPYHIQDDVLKHLSDGWDMIVAHPPCTYLSNSGVRWLYNPDKTRNEERWENMRKGAEFFNILLNSDIPMIAVENPIQHKYARELIRKPDQVIQPWQFGHGETKATCLWLKNLPKLTPTDIVEGREQRIWKMPPSLDRPKERSITCPGIASAMAKQWSEQIKVPPRTGKQLEENQISIHTNYSKIITSCRSSNLQALIIFVNTEIQNYSFQKTSDSLFFYNINNYLNYLFTLLTTYLLTTFFYFLSKISRIWRMER